MSRILVVEDDRELADLTAAYLQRVGYAVDVMYDGGGLRSRMHSQPPDCLILDVGLPDESGLQLAMDIRPTYAGGIILLTARSSQLDELEGLRIGVDDYIGKPANPEILALRIQAVLRRNRIPDALAAYEDPDLRVDPMRREVRVNGDVVPFTSGEFRLVQLLTEYVGRPLSRETYFLATTGAPYNGLDRVMDIRMSYVRRRLVAAGLPADRVSTVRGVGYQLNMPR